MNILITGIHGFVGTNLVDALASEHTIYGLDIVAPEKKGVAKTFSWEDMDNNRLPEIDAIIHLAGKAHDTKNEAAAEVYFQVNTELTKKVYDYFLAKKVAKFIFFSTVKSAADRVEGEFLTEDIVPKPVGPYGESKIAAESYILANMPEAVESGKLKVESGIEEVENERLKVEGLASNCLGANFVSTLNLQPSTFNTQRVYIFRPCMIHGPHNKGNLNLLYQVVRRGIPWPLGAFENRRSFCSVDNLSFVVGQFLSRSVESGIYHIADDESLSTNELIETMCEAMGRKAHIWRLSKGLMERVAHIGTILRLPLNKERLQKLTENYVVSNAKLKKALGIAKLPIGAKEGLSKTILSFQKEK